MKRRSKGNRYNDAVVGTVVKAKVGELGGGTGEVFIRILRKLLGVVVGVLVDQKRYLVQF